MRSIAEALSLVDLDQPAACRELRVSGSISTPTPASTRLRATPSLRRRATDTLTQPLQAFVGLPLPLGFLRRRRRRHAPCQRGFDFTAVVVIDVGSRAVYSPLARSRDEPRHRASRQQSCRYKQSAMPPFAIDANALDQDRAEAGGLPAIPLPPRFVLLPVDERGLEKGFQQRRSRDRDCYLRHRCGCLLSVFRLVDAARANYRARSALFKDFGGDTGYPSVNRFLGTSGRCSSFASLFSKVSDAFHVLFDPLANHVEGLFLRLGGYLR